MTRIELNGTWRLSEYCKETGKSSNQKIYEAQVPGSVLDTLIKSGAIPDPFYGENEKQITPLFDNDFEYSRTFSVSAALLDEDRIELVCNGIDTLGDIYINENHIAGVNNMHRSWRFDVKNILKQGDNTIRVVLYSPSKYIREAYAKGRIKYRPTGGMAGQNYLRKTHCQFGWDWGPQLPDTGIWRGIYLEGWSIVKLASVYVVQEHSQTNKTGVTRAFETSGGPVTLRVQVNCETADLRRFWAENRELKAAVYVSRDKYSGEFDPEKYETAEIISDINGTTEVTLVIDKPQLWRPNGLTASGEKQPLYNVKAELLDAKTGVLFDKWEKRIGLRTMTFTTEKDQWGNEFAMTVNGVKVFSMGADYIPEDSVFPRFNKERSRRLLEDCVKANFNSIRIWGGGYYPDDWFFDICDELGLVVWHDFMFACNVYELTDEFAANVAEEIRQNVIRIRHHPCIGLWCGNNEMEIAWAAWPGVMNHPLPLKADYIKLFEGIISGICKKHDPQNFYWPASPSSGGGFDAPNNPDRGDVHYWDVWHGGKPFKDYRNYFFRYCSEFGFQSLPDMETVQTFAAPEDQNFFSAVMEAHQRNPGGNGKILHYISETYRYPKDFASLIYISQALQLESIQTGVDHWRRHRGRCMGAIYWQLNDCWPVTSWASIDYYGRWKALHYGTRRFFSPIRATVFIDETEPAQPGSLAGALMRTVRVFIHNDTMTSSAGTISLTLQDRDFTVLSRENIDVELKPLAAREVLVRDFRDLVNTTELERSCFANIVLNINGEPVSEETALFVSPKHFNFKKPAYNIEVNETADRFMISVKAGTFCRYVRIKINGEDPVFSDNYFDLSNKNGAVVQVHKAELKKTYTARSLKDAISLFSVNESY
ncbi:MAG: glycoside hydrolase family 2 protein [Treponema sp.]|jgi:beta-mannosidase|nr:glycoside hydrolase family 2 protein [Treponema sp.]